MPNQVITQDKAVSNKTLAKVATAAGTMALTATAFAADPAAPDMSPIITMINGIVAVVGSVGMAVLSVYATAKVFKWVKTAF